MTSPISLSDIWNKSQCVKCGAVIRKGEPRCVLMFAELGIGPGHRGFRAAQLYGDEDTGLISNSSSSIAMCRPCAGDSAKIEVPNPWFILREARAADDPGGSVWATPVSQLNISSNDVAEDYVGGGEPKGNRAAARNDAEDSFISMRADSPIHYCPVKG
jgi:hypothetical protein